MREERPTGPAEDTSTIRIEPTQEPPVLIGRAPHCNIRLNNESVAPEHALLQSMGQGIFMVRGLSPERKLFLNDRDHPIERETIATMQDTLLLEQYHLPIERIVKLIEKRKQNKSGAFIIEPETPYPLPSKPSVVALGRTEERVEGTEFKVVIDHPTVAAHHATLSYNGNQFFLLDAGSATGTYVDGRRAPALRKIRIDENSRVVLGACHVGLVRDPIDGRYRLQWNFALSLDAQAISVAVPDKRRGWKRAVDTVSFSVSPTEVVGLMGPSGGGKTTLLEALNGYLLPSEGASVVNGVDLHDNLAYFRDTVGYVPQDEILYPNLTVEESVRFTARLRLPGATTAREIDKIVDQALRSLTIENKKDSLIGNPNGEKKILSGGERKRVSIAHELVMKPALLFLDEPTSGLSAEDAFNVITLLRDLANRGTTCILSIHQPSSEVYRRLDKVAYLLQGNLIYYGPAFPDSFFFFNGPQESAAAEAELLADPANVMKSFSRDQNEALAIKDEDARDEKLAEIALKYRNRFESSGYSLQHSKQPGESLPTVERVAVSGLQRPRRSDPFRLFRQAWTLTQRLAINKWRDSTNFWVLMLQAPIIGVMIALVYGASCGAAADDFQKMSQEPSALFVLVTAALWFGCSNAAREIVAEKAMYKRERMVNLSILSYLTSKLAVPGTICALQSLLLLGSARVAPWVWHSIPKNPPQFLGTIGLDSAGSFWGMYGILVLCSLGGLGMGLLVSSIVSSGEAAVAIVPLILIPQVVLGGITAPVHKMDPAPQVLSALMVSRWGFEAMMHAEFEKEGEREDNRAIRAKCDAFDCKTGELSFLPSGNPEERTYLEKVNSSSPEKLSLCGSYCLAMAKSAEFSPIERYFGIDMSDDLRANFKNQNKYKESDQVQPVHRTVAVGFKGSIGVLAGMFALLMTCVALVLFWKDPRRWANQA